MSFLVNKKNKLPITHTFAIKKLTVKEDSMVVDCHYVACLCGD